MAAAAAAVVCGRGFGVGCCGGRRTGARVVVMLSVRLREWRGAEREAVVFFFVDVVVVVVVVVGEGARVS